MGITYLKRSKTVHNGRLRKLAQWKLVRIVLHRFQMRVHESGREDQLAESLNLGRKLGVGHFLWFLSFTLAGFLGFPFFFLVVTFCKEDVSTHEERYKIRNEPRNVYLPLAATIPCLLLHSTPDFALN